MARIIDYAVVLETLTASGLVCVYHNSGSFGFPRETAVQVQGWIGPEDPTIRAGMLDKIQRVEPPYEVKLALMLCESWTSEFHGPIWVMPASHWAYELQFGSADWLPGVLAAAGVDADDLRGRSDGSAIEFDSVEELMPFVQALFMHMVGSDFTFAFPGYPVVGMLHHHRQVWWQRGLG